jgi:MFS family permease
VRFRWFFAGRAVSLAGSAMTPVALSFAVLAATDRTGDLAAVLAANSVALLSVLLLGGALADRWPRRRLLVATNAAAALTQATVAALLLSGHAPLWALVALEAANGVAAGLTQPAQRGILPELVPRPALQPANSLLATARNIAKVVGPTAAGLVVAQAGGGWAIAADATSYALAALCLSRVRVPGRPPPTGGLAAGLVEGWQEFRSRNWVVIGVVAFAGVNLVVGSWIVLGPTIAAATIGPTGWGATLSAQAVGLLAAGLAMYRLTATHPLRWAHIGAVLTVLPMIALALGAPLPWLIASALIGGAGLAVDGITWETTLQQHIPPDALSRVASYDQLGSWATVPLGELLVVPIAATVGNTMTAVLGAVLVAACSLSALAVPAVRNLRQAPGA